MTPSERVIHLMRVLDLNPAQFFLGGSACLALRDLREISDLDVGVTTNYWFNLHATGKWGVYTPPSHDDWQCCDPPYLFRVINGTEINVFHAWRRRGPEETPFNDYNLVFREGTELVQGYPCIKLPILLRQKVDAVVNGMYGGLRDKDVRDIGLITSYLESL